MSTPNQADITKAVALLKQGAVIAYPTESVFGLGCDPFNAAAVTKILTMKRRPIEKGLIIIASAWQQVAALAQPIPEARLETVFATWPGPVTWLFPATAEAPQWVCGNHDSIAIRISAHPVVHALCYHYDGPIISTSANLNGRPPARDSATVDTIFHDQVDLIISGQVGSLANPTPIRDALSGDYLRFPN